MKNVKRFLFLVVALVMLGGAARIIIVKRQAVWRGGSEGGNVMEATVTRSEVQSPAVSAVAPAASDLGAPQEVARPIEDSSQSKPVKSSTQKDSATPKQAVPVKPGGRRVKEPARDPVARAALALVGADENAALYWYEAINDPSLPANERKDLIEDLNEDGLSDPKHPTTDDLPLIVNRLLIIEEAVPYAMDDVNANAFQEAYKDLVNLANQVVGGQ